VNRRFRFARGVELPDRPEIPDLINGHRPSSPSFDSNIIFATASTRLIATRRWRNLTPNNHPVTAAEALSRLRNMRMNSLTITAYAGRRLYEFYHLRHPWMIFPANVFSQLVRANNEEWQKVSVVPNKART